MTRRNSSDAAALVAEPVGGPVEGDHDRAVREPVEHRGGDCGVSENLTPGSDGPVRGDHDRCCRHQCRIAVGRPTTLTAWCFANAANIGVRSLVPAFNTVAIRSNRQE